MAWPSEEVLPARLSAHQHSNNTRKRFRSTYVGANHKILEKNASRLFRNSHDPARTKNFKRIENFGRTKYHKMYESGWTWGKVTKSFYNCVLDRKVRRRQWEAISDIEHNVNSLSVRTTHNKGIKGSLLLTNEFCILPKVIVVLLLLLFKPAASVSDGE